MYAMICYVRLRSYVAMRAYMYVCMHVHMTYAYVCLSVSL